MNRTESRGGGRTVAVAVAVVVTLATAACTSSAGLGGSASPHVTQTPATGRATNNPDAAPAPASSPTAPAANADVPQIADLQAIATIGLASVSQVVQLHDTAVAAGHSRTIPPSVIPSTAQSMATALEHQSSDCMRLDPGVQTPQAKLATALREYSKLAGELASWDPVAAKLLPPEFFAQLAAADAEWKSALEHIGALADQNLLANVPPLLFPKG